jgi:hypothetical protein
MGKTMLLSLNCLMITDGINHLLKHISKVHLDYPKL